MVIDTRVIGLLVREKDMAYVHMLMEANMMAIGLPIDMKDMEF